MKLAVMQPYFFPYLGYFQLIHSVDHFMFFDDVQYIKKSWMGRNRLLNLETNEPFYIRPELIKPPYRALLPTVELQKDDKWKNMLLAQLKGYKNKAPYYRPVLSLVEKILDKDYKYLVDFNIESAIQISQWLGIDKKINRFTDYNFWFDEKPGIGDWGFEVARAVKTTHYINSPGGESFIFPEKFESNGIKLGFIQPELKPYDQGNENFVPGLSIIDVLLFNGKEKTSNMLGQYKVKWKN